MSLTELQKALIEAKKEHDSTTDVEKIKKECIENNTKKADIKTETKADEVYHTTNTGYWEELIPTNQLTDPVLDMIYKTSDLLQSLPWFHGENMWVSVKVPVIWEATLFRPNSEYKTWDLNSATASKDGSQTWEVPINQWQYIAEYFISQRELNYSVADLEKIALKRLAQWAIRTINAVILNGDKATTWNVNLEWWTPSANKDYYLENDWWIRKKAISNNNIVTIDTLSDWDFLSLINKLGQYASNIEDLLFLSPANVKTKILWLDAVKTIDKFWPNATILKGIMEKIYWIDNLTLRDFPLLAQASGKVHATTWNTKWSLGLIYKPAIQYGFWMTPDYQAIKVVWKWMVIRCAFEFGFGIAYQTAGLDKTVALWVSMNM